MKKHNELVETLTLRQGVIAELERIEQEEGELLDALLRARQDAGLTQAELTQRMGTPALAVVRLSNCG